MSLDTRDRVVIRGGTNPRYLATGHVVYAVDGALMVVPFDAYMSRESGPSEIYVPPYPNVDDGRWQISTNGGSYPMWSPREDELFYRTQDQMFAVPVSTDGGFEFGTPSLLFEGKYAFSSQIDYDVAPDAQRFLMIKEEMSEGGIAPNEIQIVLNWFEELEGIE